MKRKHCEVTDPKKIEAFLRKATIGRLATNGADGYPYVTPVNYVWFQERIYFHSALSGEKLDNIARDSKVCFEVDIPLAYIEPSFDQESRVTRAHQFYHCVIIRGEARVIPDSYLKTSALNALVAAHEKGRSFPPITEEMPESMNCAVVEVTPVSMTAKSDLHQHKTEEARLALAELLKNRNQPGDFETIEAMGFDPHYI